MAYGKISKDVKSVDRLFHRLDTDMKRNISVDKNIDKPLYEVVSRLLDAVHHHAVIQEFQYPDKLSRYIDANAPVQELYEKFSQGLVAKVEEMAEQYKSDYAIIRGTPREGYLNVTVQFIYENDSLN